jgi:hypothetical protein
MNMCTHPNEISDTFWNIINRAQKDRSKLKAILLEFDREDLNRFRYQYKEAAYYLTDDRFVKYMLGRSEDDIEDLTEWVVGQGKEYFMDIWNHPEHIPPYIPGSRDSHLGNVVFKVWREKFGYLPDDFGEMPDEEPST